MTSPIDRLLESVRTLPSIPKALSEVLESLNKENVTVAEVTRPLESDPALSAKVLRMSNAAHYGLPKQVASVEEAAYLVGMNAIRTMVISSGLMGSFDAIPGFDMKRFWRLSLLSGFLARDLASILHLPSEEAYTAALMHGLGILAIHGAFPEDALAIDSACVDLSPVDRAECEMERLGFHHGDVGSEIASRWKLPDSIVQTIRFYPYPKRLAASNLAGVVHCAVALAIALEDRTPQTNWGMDVDSELCRKLGLDWDKLKQRHEKFELYRTAADDMVS
jgi:HD-like signal output (HDOD) protein